MKPFLIKIAQKLAPFSHTTLFRCLIPKTACLAEIFPTFISLEEWGGKSFKTRFMLTGPIEGFTAEIDCHKKVVRLFGEAKEGFFRYRLFAEGDAIYFYLEKGPLPFPVKMKQKLMDLSSFNSENQKERLSLGMHKKQEWELVLRRGDLREIFPLWHAFGALLPHQKEKIPKKEGNYALLEACRQVITKKEKLKVVSAFKNLFSALFSGVFVPHLNDPSFLGLSSYSKKLLSPLPLLQESGRLIRSLFFQEEKENFFILPLLPPEFHAGRFLCLQTATGDRIDLEWSKKLLRRAIIHPHKSREVHLILQKPIRRFRVRTSRKGRGTTHVATEPLSIEAGHTLFLDRFQK